MADPPFSGRYLQSLRRIFFCKKTDSFFLKLNRASGDVIRVPKFGILLDLRPQPLVVAPRRNSRLRSSVFPPEPSL